MINKPRYRHSVPPWLTTSWNKYKTSLYCYVGLYRGMVYLWLQQI